MSSDEGSKSVSRRQIARLIGGSSLPIYVLDESDVVVFVNDAWVRRIGRDSESILGLRCGLFDRESVDLVDRSLVADMCLPTQWDRNTLIVESLDDGNLRCLLPLEVEPQTADSQQKKPSAVLCVLIEESLRSFLLRAIAPSEDFHDRIRRATQGMDPLNLWFLAGKSLSVSTLRRQIANAVKADGSLVIEGPARTQCNRLAKSIARIRQSTIGKIPWNACVVLDCQLMDAQLLENVFEAFDEASGAYGRQAYMIISGLDQLPVELGVALDRYLARQAHPSFLVTYKNKNRFNPKLEVMDRILTRASHSQISIPPLRDRMEDLDAMISAWFETRQIDAKGGLRDQTKSVASHYRLQPECRDALYAYPWPGDLDELAHTLEQLFSSSENLELSVADLPTVIRTCPSHVERSSAVQSIQLDSILEAIERKLSEEALEFCKGNRSAASKLLGISRARFIRRLQHWGIVSSQPEVDEQQDLPRFEEI